MGRSSLPPPLVSRNRPMVVRPGLQGPGVAVGGPGVGRSVPAAVVPMARRGSSSQCCCRPGAFRGRDRYGSGPSNGRHEGGRRPARDGRPSMEGIGGQGYGPGAAAPHPMARSRARTTTNRRPGDRATGTGAATSRCNPPSGKGLTGISTAQPGTPRRPRDPGPPPGGGGPPRPAGDENGFLPHSPSHEKPLFISHIRDVSGKIMGVDSFYVRLCGS